MNGLDLLRTMVEVANLNTGKGFSACFDFDFWPEYIHGPASDETALRLAGEEVERRMADTNKAFEKLIGLALKSTIIWNVPGRGWGVKTEQELSPEEEQALLKVESELAKIDTFISNPVYH